MARNTLQKGVDPITLAIIIVCSLLLAATMIVGSPSSLQAIGQLEGFGWLNQPPIQPASSEQIVPME